MEQRNKAEEVKLVLIASSTMPTLLFFALSALVFSVCHAGGDGRRPHFDENYLVGMRAYTEEEWAEAAPGMQQAVTDFERYSEASVNCLELCEGQQVSSGSGMTQLLLHY